MKPYAAIEDEDGKRVIPSSWLTKDKKHMAWPPFKESSKIRKSIISLAEPADDWQSYEVLRVIKFYDDYNKAVSDLKTLIDRVSNVSDTEALKRTRSQRAKRKFENTNEPITSINLTEREEDNSSDASDTSSSSETGTRNVQNLNTQDNRFENKTLTPPESLVQESSILQPPTSRQSVEQSSNVSITVNNIDTNNHEPSDVDVENWNPNDAKQALNTVYGMQKTLLKEFKTFAKQFKIFESKFSGHVPIGRSSVVPNTVDSTFLLSMAVYFPIDDIDKKLDAVEDKLKVDRQFFNNVVLFMKSKGGGTHHEMAYNILSAVITNELADGYSFVGHKKKKVFSELGICSCIFHSIKEVHISSSDSDIKTSISKWLDAAGTRKKRAETQSVPRKRKALSLMLPPPE